MAQFSVPISDIVDLLGLEQSPRKNPAARSIKVHCPFCGHKGYTMDVDLVSNVFHCFYCPDEYQKNTGALDLYSRVRLGGPSYQFNRKKVFRQLCEELGSKAPRQNARPTVVPDRNIYPADDEHLNAVYSALLKLPYLRLQKKHADNLIKRGLTEKAAYKGRFATLPPSYIVIKDHHGGKATTEWYWSHNVDEIRKKSSTLKWYKWKDIVAGVIIATDLIHQGLDLSGVPGFYHITPKKWAFRYDTGMLIPTISYEGNIVGFQTRRDNVTKDGLRYMTLSSKGLSDGVTANIARTHVVHNKKAISSNTTVLITEGPLKADIILWFLTRNKREDIAVVALQGVKNVRELPSIVEKLRRDGVSEILSAFDMDKCTNVAVADAGVALRKLLQKGGLKVNTLVWDEEYALSRRQELLDLANANNIAFSPSNNPFVDLTRLSKIFTQNKIVYNMRVVDGVEIKENWGAKKGYDDLLFSLYGNKGQKKTT